MVEEGCVWWEVKRVTAPVWDRPCQVQPPCCIFMTCVVTQCIYTPGHSCLPVPLKFLPRCVPEIEEERRKNIVSTIEMCYIYIYMQNVINSIVGTWPVDFFLEHFHP